MREPEADTSMGEQQADTERTDTPGFRSMGQQGPPPGPQGFNARARLLDVPNSNAVCGEISTSDIVSGAQS